MSGDTTMMRLEELTGKLPTWEKPNRKTNNEVKTMNKIINAFHFVRDDELYGEVLRIVLDVMQSKYGVFGYINSKGAFVCPSMTKNVWEKCQVEQKDVIFPRETWGKSMWGRAIIKNKILYSNRPFKVPEGHISIRRALMVPISYRKEVIGLFEVANKKKDYTKDDACILKKIARLISPILMARLERDGVCERGG